MRYWKLEQSVNAGKAFPMGVMGSGTFDGIFVRQGYSFQLYQNTEEPIDPCDLRAVSPFMCGPQFVSIDYWRDVFPAPDGFEPGTYFVHGVGGALANYSIIIYRGCLDCNKVDDINDGNCVQPGSVINYTINYDFNGLGGSNVTIIDHLPAEVNYNSSSPEGDYNVLERTVKWNILIPPVSGLVELSVTVNGYARPGRQILNVAEIDNGTYFIHTEVNTSACYWTGNIIYVDKDAINGGNNGTSWDNAFLDFNDALEQSKLYVIEFGGCEIWVAEGPYKPTYEPPNYWNASFRVPAGNIAIRGHFGGIGWYETSPDQRDFNNPSFETILDGRVGSEYYEKANYVITCEDIGNDLVLDGFTFTGASTSGLYNL